MLEIYENRKDIGYIHVASCNYFTDAISIAILRGKGVEIRYGHSEDYVLWIVPEKYDYRNKGVIGLDDEEDIILTLLGGIAKIKSLEKSSRRELEDIGPNWIEGIEIASKIKSLTE